MNESKIINSIQLINKYAVFSTILDDPIFIKNKNQYRTPIFCGGRVLSCAENVYDLKTNDFVVYQTAIQELNSSLPSNLVFRIENERDLNLIAIIPYASYAMKLLREINPKLGDSILIVGKNFFSILLEKLIKLSGARVHIIGLQEELSEYSNNKIDLVIIISEFNQKLLNLINFKESIDISQISVYDKGLDDENYLHGIDYPYSYVRWDYKKNLKYFIYLIEASIIDLDFLEFLTIEVNSIEEIEKIAKEITGNLFILFKIM